MTKEWADRLPKRLRVAAYDFKIELLTHHQSTARRAFGECSINEQLISIQEEMPNLAKLVDTVLHEAGHAIYWAYGIDDADKEERIVGAMGTAWTQVWRDNPDLLDWLSAAMVEVRR